MPNEPGGDFEPDDLDEAFACYDIRQKGDQWDRDTVIVDDELHDLLARVPAGVLFEVLLDTCHSGTGLKDLDEIMQAQLLGRKPRFLPPPTRKGLDQRGRCGPAPPRGRSRPQGARRADQEPVDRVKPVLFAACRPDQTASDATFGGRPNGAFTYLFLKALTEDPTRDARRPAAARSRSVSRTATSASARRSRARSSARRSAFGQPW